MDSENIKENNGYNTKPRYQSKEPRNDKQSYRTDRNQRYYDSNYRSDENRRNSDNSNTRYNNGSKFRDNRDRNNRDRRANGYNGHQGNGRKHKNFEKKSNPEPVTNGHQDSKPVSKPPVPTKPVDNDKRSTVVTEPKQEKPEKEPVTAEVTKVKPSHGHYHHKNSNKPRFAKMFTENVKEMKKEKGAEKKVDEAVQTKPHKNGSGKSPNFVI